MRLTTAAMIALTVVAAVVLGVWLVLLLVTAYL